MNWSSFGNNVGVPPPTYRALRSYGEGTNWRQVRIIKLAVNWLEFEGRCRVAAKPSRNNQWCEAMPAMKPRTSLLLFFVVAILGLALHFFIFEMRYMWHVSQEDFRLLGGGYIAFVVLIAALWGIFPSRILVAIVGLLALFFPHLYYVSDARPLLGREIDPPSIVFALLGVVLLVAATELRCRSKAQGRRLG